MDPNLCLSTCVEDKTDPSKVVTSVVPATMSPMPKSERKENAFSKKQNSSISMSVCKNPYVPSLDNVETLYKLSWILANVGG